MIKDMIKDMINDVLTTIKKHNLINEGNCILVGISGGPDSVCLLHVLCTLRKKLRLTICAVHVNHMLRGNESEQDQNYVVELCRRLEVPLAVEQCDIEAISKAKRISIEEAGRNERYKLFRKHVVSFEADLIAVAHNKNDQAETVLMNLIRGTGLLGLKGIEYKRDNIIRPLLDIEREKIEAYCRENFLKPRIDSSNLKNIYRRNKIRLELIPMIDAQFNTNIVESITRMGGIVRESLDYLDGSIMLSYEACCKTGRGVEMGRSSKTREAGRGREISRSYDASRGGKAGEMGRSYEASRDRKANETGRTCKTGETENEVILDLDKFNLNHIAIRKGIIRQAVKEIKGDLNNISLEHVESVAVLALEGLTGSILQLPGKLTVRKSYGTLIFKIDKEGIKSDTESMEKEAYDLKTGMQTEVMRAEDYHSKNIKMEDTAFEQFFDYESLNKGITIRYRCKGDVFKPHKSNGTKKLKEYFIDEKIPRNIRDNIPLIAIENEIVWIIGYKTSDKYKINDKTKHVLGIKFNLGGQNAK